MSDRGDVTAAIERLRAPIRTHDGDYHSWEWIPAPDDVLAVLAEVERLRAEVRHLSVLADSEAIERTHGRLRDENQRLHAEREALHSDETRGRLWDVIFAARDRDGEQAPTGDIVDAVLAELTDDPSSRS